MRPLLIAFCLMLPLAGPAAAEPPDHGGPGPGKLGETGREIIEGLERFRAGIAQLLEEIPRFAPPEFTEDGDIILRRIDPPGDRLPDEDRPAPPVPAPGPVPGAGKRAVEI